MLVLSDIVCVNTNSIYLPMATFLFTLILFTFRALLHFLLLDYKGNVSNL